MIKIHGVKIYQAGNGWFYTDWDATEGRETIRWFDRLGQAVSSLLVKKG